MEPVMITIPLAGLIAWLVVGFAVGFGAGGGFIWLRARIKARRARK